MQTNLNFINIFMEKLHPIILKKRPTNSLIRREKLRKTLKRRKSSNWTLTRSSEILEI